MTHRVTIKSPAKLEGFAKYLSLDSHRTIGRKHLAHTYYYDIPDDNDLVKKAIERGGSLYNADEEGPGDNQTAPGLSGGTE